MSVDQIRDSGMLELYVIGDLTDAEILEVENAINEHPSLRQEIHEIEISLEKYAKLHEVSTDATEKPMLLAMADYARRMQEGEVTNDPPALHKDSKIIDFAPWLQRTDMVPPEEYDSMYGKVIGNTEEKTTLIIWLKDGAPDETHVDELETFLIVEGTCNITIGDQVNSLKPGDVLSIPLHINHRVEVTSDIACKIILERKAA